MASMWYVIYVTIRREYNVALLVNGVKITKVLIDSHYEKKHAESINDDIILGLVMQLNGKDFEADQSKLPFQYFVTDRIKYSGKFYKLIWLMEEHEIYIGVINAYRR